MKLFALPAVLLVAANATSLQNLSTTSLAATTHSVEYKTNTLTQTRAKTQVVATTVYLAAKNVLDGICLVYENGDDLLRLGQHFINLFDDLKRGINNQAFRNGLTEASRLFRHGMQHMAREIEMWGNGIQRAAEQTATRLARPVQVAVTYVAQHIGTFFRSIFGLAQVKATQTRVKTSRRRDFSLAQIKAKARLRVQTDSIMSIIGSDAGTKIGETLRVLITALKNSPWGAKITAAEDIQRFVQKVQNGGRIDVEDGFDLGCAINAFLPSYKSLMKFQAMSRVNKVKALKRQMRRSFQVDKMIRWSKTQGRRCLAEYVRSQTICHVINEDEAAEPFQALEGTGPPVAPALNANHLTWTDERNPGDGHLEHIAVANNGNVWAIRRDTGQAYYLRGAGERWQIPSANRGPIPRFNSISVAGGQGDHIWATTFDQQVYYRHGLGGRWELQEGELDQVAVCGVHGQQVIGLMRGRIMVRPGRPNQNGQWSRMHGELSQVACGGGHGTHLWGIKSNRDVYYQEGIHVAPNEQWFHVPNQKLDYISVGGDEGQHVYGHDRLNTYTDMYRNGFEADWTTFGGVMTEVAVGGDEGQHVWGINKTTQWNYIKAANHGNVNENTN